MTLVGREWQYQGTSHHLIVTHAPASAFVPVVTQFNVALAGEHQLENAVVALAALDAIKGDFSGITLATAQRGLATVAWEGRLQTVYAGDGPTFLVDSAHNKDSAAKLAAALIKDYAYQDLWFLFGAPQDKAIAQMMVELFPLAKGIIVAAADHPRAASPSRLEQTALEQGFSVIPASSPAQALRMAFAHAAAGDLICACGSIIFVGDLLNQWDRLQSELTAK
jgi:dihydrofolate synthase/folylpolyglutamate synthase